MKACPLALLLLFPLLSVAPAQCPPNGGYGPPPKVTPPPPPPPPRDAGVNATGGSGTRTPGDTSPPAPRPPAAVPTPTPTAPTTPSPSQPATPGPVAPAAGPTTGPAVPGAAAPGRAAGRRPVPMTFDRGRTAKKLLELDWDYPVYVPADTGTTRVSGPLARAELFAHLADGDPRPLLVLRECQICAGTNIALLASNEPNDRTLLLTRWFHCIKLPPDVLHPNHAFRGAFDGEHPSHLFLCLADGSQVHDLDGRQSQNELWRALSTTLRAAYAKDAASSLKELMSLLDDFDRVDGEMTRLETELQKALERSGAKAPKVADLQKKLEAVCREHAGLLAREQELRDLGPPRADSAPAGDPKAGTAGNGK